MTIPPRRPGARTASWLPILLLVLLSSAALAQETILQNDGFVDGQPVGFQGGFVAGESGSVRLVPAGPFPMTVTRVQLLFGGSTATQTVTLRIWDDSAGTAAPGAELYSADYLLTGSDTVLQEIDLSGAGIQVAGAFRVGIEFQHSGAPSIARDSDGITAARNFIYALGLGWFDSGALGLTGDWIIRAGVQPVGGGGGDEPSILSVVDIGNDQGRKVRVSFAPSALDAPGSATPIMSYEVYRRADPVKGVAPPGDRDRATLLLGGWDYVASAPAHGESGYSLVVPTLADSTIADGQHWSVFLVRAATASPYVFFDSAPDSGWSLDNLAPSAPTGLALAGGVLSWAPSTAADFDYFSVFGSASPTFDGSAALLGHTTATSLAASGSPHPYYFVTATDFAGNRGAAAALLAATAVYGPAAAPAWGLSAWPNPFNPRTTVALDLPAAAAVVLDIHAVDGARVRRLLAAELGPGRHTVAWDGRDDGGRAVAAGHYVARLQAGGRTLSRRLVLVR